MNIDFRRNFRASQALIAHLMAHGLGLFALAAFIGQFVNNLIPYHFLFSGVYDSYENQVLTKIAALMHYVVGVSCFFTLFVILQLIKKKAHLIDKILPDIDARLLAMFIVSGVMAGFTGCVGAFFGHYSVSKSLFVLGLGWWFLSLLIPFVYALNSILVRGELFADGRRIKYMMVSVVIVASLATGVALGPLLIGKMQIMNDFIDLPEYTILNDGSTVDNHVFINKNNMEGLTRHDPRYVTDHLIDYNIRMSVELPYRLALDYFISNSAVSNLAQRFYYDHPNSRLVVLGVFHFDDLNSILSIYPEENFQRALRKLYNEYLSVLKENKLKVSSKIENEFINKNYFEMTEQFQLGRFFYHHNYILAPALAYSQGKKNIPSVYGLGLTRTLASTLKYINKFNYYAYLKILYGSYLFYLLLFVALSWVFWRRLEYVAIVATFGSASLVMQNPVLLAMAPGFSPLRHIFDIIVFYCLWRFFITKRIWWCLGTYSFCLAGIWWNQQYGMILLAAVITANIGCWWNGRCSKLSLAIPLGGIVGALWQISHSSDNNPLGIYMALGVGTPTTGISMVFLCLLGASVLLICVAILKPTSDRNSTIQANWLILLAIATYVIESMVYLIWYPSSHHIYPVVFPWAGFVGTGLLWLRHNRNNNDIRDSWSGTAVSIALCLGLFILPMISIHWYQQRQVGKIFSSHKVYSWDFAGAGFLTTMDPGPMAQAIKLIDKYSGENGITIVSKYDVILPFMSNKAVVGPFVTLADIFVTHKESSLVINSIKESKPEYVFIDSDIGRSYIGDIPAKDSILGKGAANSVPLKNLELAQGRAVMLRCLTDIYDGIKNEYEIHERGQLITVYRRKL